MDEGLRGRIGILESRNVSVLERLFLKCRWLIGGINSDTKFKRDCPAAWHRRHPGRPALLDRQYLNT